MDTMLRNGTGSSKGSTLPDRLALYKQMDETRHEELSNLAQAVMTLEDKLRTAKADLEDEQMTRRQYRRRAEEAESAAVSEPYPTRACFTYRLRRACCFTCQLLLTLSLFLILTSSVSQSVCLSTCRRRRLHLQGCILTRCCQVWWCRCGLSST